MCKMLKVTASDCVKSEISVLNVIEIRSFIDRSLIDEFQVSWKTLHVERVCFHPVSPLYIFVFDTLKQLYHFNLSAHRLTCLIQILGSIKKSVTQEKSVYLQCFVFLLWWQTPPNPNAAFLCPGRTFKCPLKHHTDL